MLTLALLTLLAQEDPPPSLADDGFAGLKLHTRVRMYYPQTVKGRVKGESDEPSVQLDDDLDLDSPGWTPMGEAAILWDNRPDDTLHGIGISATGFATSGKEVLKTREVFQDHLFPAGTEMRSRFRFKEFGVDGIIMSRCDSDELFGFRGSLGLHYLEAEIHLSGATGTESEEYLDFNLKLSFSGEVRPVRWVFAGATASLYSDIFSLLAGVDSGHYGGEGEIYAGFQAGPVRVEGGYRIFGWSLSWWDSEIDLVNYGPWASLSVRF
jgi:hypothetical protein